MGTLNPRTAVNISTKPTVCIVESLGFLEEQTHREGEIVSRTLKLSRKQSAYAYVRSKLELEAAVKEFGESKHRYLHLSCHGVVSRKKKHAGFHLTTEQIAIDDLVRILAPHLKGRRVFLSSCRAGSGNFAETLLLKSKCLSVLAPTSDIDFDDAAVFWTAFYHLMFKGDRKVMSAARIKANVKLCASLVGEEFRLTYRTVDGNVRAKTIAPIKSAKHP